MAKQGMENPKRAPQRASTRLRGQDRRPARDTVGGVRRAVPTTQLSGGRRPRVGTVYLLHFSKPYYHARHYLGFTQDMERRLKEHRRGMGSRLVRAVVNAGIEIFLARRWDNVRFTFERRVHNMHREQRYKCPICGGPAAHRLCKPRRDPVTGVGG